MIVNFFDTKGPDLVVTFFGTLLGFGLAAWIYRWQVADSDAAAKRQAADQLVTEARRANEVLSTERRREFDALAAERRQAADLLASEKRQVARTKEADLLAIRQRRIDHIKWLTGILQQVIDYATDQGAELDKLTAAIDADPSELHPLGIIASSSIQRLTRADNEATFHAYNTVFIDLPDKEKQYKDLLKYTDFLTAQIEDLLARYRRYQQSLYDRQLRLKFILEQSVNELSTLKNTMDFGGAQANYAGSSFYNDVNNMLLLNRTLMARAAKFKQIQVELIRPLILILLSERQFPGADAISKKLKDFNTGFTDLQHDSGNFKNGLNTKLLRAANDKLEGIRKRLEEGYTAAESALSDSHIPSEVII